MNGTDQVCDSFQCGRLAALSSLARIRPITNRAQPPQCGRFSVGLNAGGLLLAVVGQRARCGLVMFHRP